MNKGETSQMAIERLEKQVRDLESRLKAQHEDLWNQIKIFKDHNVKLYGDWAAAADQADAAAKQLVTLATALCRRECDWREAGVTHTKLCVERVKMIEEIRPSPAGKLVESARKLLSGGYRQDRNGLVLNSNQVEEWLGAKPKKCSCVPGGPHSLFCVEYQPPPGVEH